MKTTSLSFLLLFSISVYSQSAVTYCNRGGEKFNLNDYLGAIEDFTAAIEIDPNLAPAFYSRGRSKLLLQDYQGSISDFTRAIEINPKYPDNYVDRGSSKYGLKDYLGAIADFTRAIQIDPNRSPLITTGDLQKQTLAITLGQ